MSDIGARIGGFARGRAGVTNLDTRLVDDAAIARARKLLSAIEEVDDRIPSRMVAFTASYDAGGLSSEFYVPFGGGAAAGVGASGVEHLLLPPFTKAVITRIVVLSSTNPVSLRPRLRRAGDEGIVWGDGSGVLQDAAANEVAVWAPKYEWDSGDPLLVSVGAGQSIDGVAVQVTVEEG